MAGTTLIAAVPAEVSCAVPIMAEFRQKVAVASQNVTVPAVTGEPFDTAAVNVTAVPDATDEAESVSVVVVGTVAVTVKLNGDDVLAKKFPSPG
jgi:hypothetical protein